MEKPRVTEIMVRIDCNGCVQKIKKSLHGINGINDIYINIPQQKLTIIGWADLEKIVKAIKKTRKHAIMFSETQPSPPTEPPLEGSAPPSDPSNQPPTPKPNEPPENPPLEPEPAPAPTAQEPQSTLRQPPQLSGSKEAEEVHIVHHYPPDHGHGHRHDQRASVEHYSNLVQKHEPPLSVHVTHGYNTYKPAPYVTKYTRSPPQYSHYSRPEPPQQFTHYNTPEPPPQQTHYTRPELPKHYTHYNRPEPPPQQTHYARPEVPPQHYTYYNKPEPPPQQTHYARPEPPQQHTNYNTPKPQPQETRYTRPELPQHHTRNNRPEPLRPYTNNGPAELPPRYTNYSGEYHRSRNGNDNITSIFSDDNPNACTIV